MAELELPDPQQMYDDLLRNYSEMFHEEPDFDEARYEEQVSAMDEDDLREEWLTFFGPK
jgi:hypothetical protein